MCVCVGGWVGGCPARARPELTFLDPLTSPCVQIKKAACKNVCAAERVGREIQVLRVLDHRYIVPLLDTFQLRDTVCLVFESYPSGGLRRIPATLATLTL